MDVGCNTYSLARLPRQAVFTELRALGFSLVELWTGHASYLRDDVDPVAVAAEARAAGLGIRAYCIGGLFGLPLPLVEERLRGAFQFARALGVDLVTGIVDRSAVEAVGTEESMMQAIQSTRAGGSVGFVGVFHGMQLPAMDLFWATIHLHGGPAPVRQYLPELIDLTLPLEQVAEGYRAMDERRAIKALLRP